MDRERFYGLMAGTGESDYEIYLNTRALLACQKDFHSFCNHDELQFQILHQAQELWMKLIGYTLLDIDERIQQEETQRVLSLFSRVHRIQRVMIDMFSLLDTMSPKEYQEIRVHLGNGSGRDSPGFRVLTQMGKPLWDSFTRCYLERHNLTVEKIYFTEYAHTDAYVVAEALAEFDQLFQMFRQRHLQHVQRSIGLGAMSLKGRPVKILEEGLRFRFFPQLWEIRNRMTDSWKETYGEVRESIRPESTGP
jgi:tryptophan 2,3-dioxygenase